MKELNVLFVDDEKNLLKSFQRIFLNEPIKVYLANNGEEALGILSTENIDLIVTDIKMPNMHGMEFIEEIRKMGLSIPIYIYSAYNKMLEDRIAKTRVVKALYSKPDDYNVLCEKIKEIAIQKYVDIIQ